MEIVVLIIKVAIILTVYFVGGPVLGFLMKGNDLLRRLFLGFTAWWLVRPPSDFTLMLYSIETYRGHAKGFEFNFIEGIAIGFALAAILEKRHDFKLFPPGLILWLSWIMVSLFSVVNAIEPLYVFMPAFKFLKMSFVIVGVFAAIRGEKDILAIMRGFAIALIVQVIICLWGRYIQGGFRVTGWFEHQNPMSMWCYMVGMPIFGLALAKETSKKDMWLYFIAFGAAGLTVVLTVSRASLAAFGAGAAIMLMGSFLNGFTFRRIAIGVAGGLGGVFVIAMAADTFMARMGEDDTPENDLRFALNNQSKAMLADHPVAGIGWNNYGLANSRPRGNKYSAVLEKWEENRGRRIRPEQFMANPLTESLYWLLLAENGYIGFFFFLLFVIQTSWFGIRNTFYFWKTPLGLLFYGIAVSLLITYFHGQVERVLTQTKNLTTWIILCTIVSKAEWWRRQDKKRLK
ncbi:O-antigen ligase family protein [Rubritalea marina]|uniref:O-antigen ligase family protein n=1 Tax=Rubritalea marina TaxID=361055 RepID=UPI00036A89D9|nr:O-antigen ligase family protein [Rubritalea marina]